MNSSQSLSQDIFYDLNFSNKISISNENSITDSLISEKFISEENINEINTKIILPEWYEDKWYVTIAGMFLFVIIGMTLYIFVQYF